MKSKLYVGNVSFQTNENDLENLFSQYGDVNSVKIITDRETGRSRGFAFVEMAGETDAQKAIEGLNGKEAFGRSLRVNIAQEKKDRPPRNSNHW
jgi:RNA recognition motif-containing protein